MSDLKLVAPDPPTPLERMLLDAVAKESPSAEQRLRVRQALGLPAVPLLAEPLLRAGRRSLWLKAGASGLVVISAALLLVLSGVGRKAQPTFTPQSVAAPVFQPSAPVQAVPGAAQPLAMPLPPLEPARELVPAAKPSVRSRAASAPSAAPEVAADLSEQLRLIEAARAAVAAGNASAAAAAIASYRSRFPRGPFGQEAAVLQIETVDLQGNHAQAAALARSFLARHPNSPHVGLVQRIAGRAQ
jgi:hypothetical protein